MVKAEDLPWFVPEEGQDCCKNCINYEASEKDWDWGLGFDCSYRYRRGTCLVTDTSTEDEHICDYHQREE